MAGEYVELEDAPVPRGNFRPSSDAVELSAGTYEKLRCIAAEYLRSERAGHTLQPTALLHEAFLRVLKRPDHYWRKTSRSITRCGGTSARPIKSWIALLKLTRKVWDSGRSRPAWPSMKKVISAWRKMHWRRSTPCQRTAANRKPRPPSRARTCSCCYANMESYCRPQTAFRIILHTTCHRPWWEILCHRVCATSAE